jgi:hypothetical protein
MKKRSDKTSLSIAMVGLVAVLCGGCILPVPHTRVHAFGVAGQVVSAVDHKPIGGALVASIDAPPATTYCDSGGNFRLSARLGWHAAYLVSPICESLLPGFDVAPPDREIRVSAPGYLTTEFGVSPFAGGDGHAMTGVIAGAYLKAGQFPITPVGDNSTKQHQ